MILLFDLDDTLYPEKNYIYQGLKAVAKYLGRKTSKNYLKIYFDLIYLFNKGSKKIFDDYLKINNLSVDLNEILKIYRYSKKKIKTYPDVIPALKYLKRFNNKLIMITNGEGDTQRTKIETLKLKNIFDDIYILDDFGKDYWKPSTLILDNVLFKKYSEKREDYIFVGNSKNDYEFAKNGGLKFFYIKRKKSLFELENKEQIYIINNLYELIFILERRIRNENSFIKTMDNKRRYRRGC